MARAKYNWTEIEQRFVTSREGTTLEDVAKEYGCSYRTIRDRASKGDWYQRRRQFADKVRNEAEDRAVSHQAKRRANMLKVADGMKSAAAMSLKRLLEEMENDPTKRLSVNELRQMFKDATDIERAALGMPDREAMNDGEIDAKIADLVARFDAARNRDADE